MKNERYCALWMLFAAFFFSMMAVCVKIASQTYRTPEIIFYRSLFSVVAIALFVIFSGRKFTTQHWKMHSRRAAFATFSMSVWFYTPGVLPIALSVTLNYMSPLFVSVFTGLTAVLTGKRIPRLLCFSAVLGFSGVLTLANPVIGMNQTGSIGIGILGALFAALSFKDLKTLTQTGEPEWKSVFYLSVFSCIAATFGIAASGTSIHSRTGVLALLSAGICGTLGQLGLSFSYGRGNILVAASLQFSGVIFSSIWGILLMDDKFSMSLYSGIVLIIAAGILSIASRN